MGKIILYDSGTITLIDEKEIYVPVFQNPKEKPEKEKEETNLSLIQENDN